MPTFGVALDPPIIFNFNIKPMTLHGKNGIRKNKFDVVKCSSEEHDECEEVNYDWPFPRLLQDKEQYFYIL